jgi:hypothetical protein
MPEFIRVRWNDSGTEQSIPEPTAIDEDAYTVLKEDAVDRNGRVLPSKFPVKNKSGQKAATEKEKS